MKSEFKCKIVLTVALSLGVGTTCVAKPQAEDLKPAAVRIQNASQGSWGNGFIFRIDDKEHAVYILTNAHVAGDHETVNVKFSAQPTRTVEGMVLRRDKGKDLGLVKVIGASKIPGDVMLMSLGEPNVLRAGDSVQLVLYSAANDGWSIQGGTVELLRDEIIDLNSRATAHVIRFSSNIREGDSGAPLLLGDYVVGIVARGLGSGTGSPVAIQVGSIQDFLGDLLPPRPAFPGYKAAKREGAVVDKAAELCATQFLDLLIQNRLLDAYRSLADVAKSDVGEAGFVQTYSQFANGAKSGLSERQLASAQKLFSLPNRPQITADVYLLDFESRYQDILGTTVFEGVTVVKENGIWRVANFTWNSQPRSQTDR